MGRRDYAIPMMLAKLGLRADEVATLTLDDIDWRAGVVGAWIGCLAAGLGGVKAAPKT
jgi:integrase